MRYFLLVSIFFPLLVSGQINAGIVQGIWYSDDAVFSGNEVSIYSAIRNYSNFNISGIADFYDDSKLISSVDFSIASKRLIELSTSHNFEYGQHTVEIRLRDVINSDTNGSADVGFSESVLSSSELFVDLDSDKDGIGNADDKDDDNDGFSDVIELNNGSNPLSNISFPVDVDGDGIPNEDDPDDDNDGFSDVLEIRAGSDPHDTLLFPVDVDGDGIPNEDDPDDDNDGFSDTEEMLAGTDSTDSSLYPGSDNPVRKSLVAVSNFLLFVHAKINSIRVSLYKSVVDNRGSIILAPEQASENPFISRYQKESTIYQSADISMGTKVWFALLGLVAFLLSNIFVFYLCIACFTYVVIKIASKRKNRTQYDDDDLDDLEIKENY